MGILRANDRAASPRDRLATDRRRYRKTVRKLAVTAAVLVGILTAVPSVASASPRATLQSPSKSAKMICSREGQKDIAISLGGAKPTIVTASTWRDHVYSCTYMYPSGPVSLSVKELGTHSATNIYVAALAQALGRRSDRLPLGQAAFWTTTGSVIVRKDTKVLLVDTSHLTAGLGVPPESASDAAANIAAAILGCWTGT